MLFYVQVKKSLKDNKVDLDVAFRLIKVQEDSIKIRYTGMKKLINDEYKNQCKNLTASFSSRNTIDLTDANIEVGFDIEEVTEMEVEDEDEEI